MKYKTPIRSIRLKCLDCCAGSAHEVKLCQSKNCPLYHYRFGVRPTTAQKRGKLSKSTSKLNKTEQINDSKRRFEV